MASLSSRRPAGLSGVDSGGFVAQLAGAAPSVALALLLAGAATLAETASLLEPAGIRVIARRECEGAPVEARSSSGCLWSSRRSGAARPLRAGVARLSASLSAELQQDASIPR